MIKYFKSHVVKFIIFFSYFYQIIDNVFFDYKIYQDSTLEICSCLEIIIGWDFEFKSDWERPRIQLVGCQGWTWFVASHPSSPDILSSRIIQWNKKKKVLFQTDFLQVAAKRRECWCWYDDRSLEVKRVFKLIYVLSQLEIPLIIKVIKICSGTTDQNPPLLAPLYSLSKKWPLITKSQKEKFQFPCLVFQFYFRESVSN